MIASNSSHTEVSIPARMRDDASPLAVWRWLTHASKNVTLALFTFFPSTITMERREERKKKKTEGELASTVKFTKVGSFKAFREPKWRSIEGLRLQDKPLRHVFNNGFVLALVPNGPRL